MNSTISNIIISLSVTQQQEEEELMRLLADENAFKLLTGSIS
jgi:hypothetical protein